MKQQRLKAYLGLIQELLTCPQGEEWIRLRQHEDLVDAGLVQTLEQVATTLAQEGRQQEAIFLHNWAGQLHHILAQPRPQEPEKNLSQSYVDFINALLEATPEEQQNLIVANQHLVTPSLVQMMRQISAQLAAQGDLETSSYLNRLAEELGKLWLHHHDFESRPQSKQEESVEKEPLKSRFKQAPMGEQAPVPPPFKAAAPLEEKAQSSELPDPWTVAAPASAMVENLAEPLPQPTSTSPAGPAVEESLPASTLQRVEAHLSTIAAALTQLNQHLARSTVPANPLEHLDALEKAHQSGWVLTTEEVEALIHTHPKCSGHENTFERGCWRFCKVGKIGQQMGWKVEKPEVNPDVTVSETL
jgi:hypothetical protein